MHEKCGHSMENGFILKNINEKYPGGRFNLVHFFATKFQSSYFWLVGPLYPLWFMYVVGRVEKTS